MTTDEYIEDIEDIEEGMVAIDVEVVEETILLDGNSSGGWTQGFQEL